MNGISRTFMTKMNHSFLMRSENWEERSVLSESAHEQTESESVKRSVVIQELLKTTTNKESKKIQHRNTDQCGWILGNTKWKKPQC
jgi:hypothetical protein